MDGLLHLDTQRQWTPNGSSRRRVHGVLGNLNCTDDNRKLTHN